MGAGTAQAAHIIRAALMQPLVSVIVPVYNGQNHLAQALESALSQDYPNKEVIVVNDGSTDGTAEVLRSFGDRIHAINQSNGGPPKARNAGLNAARGEYIAFLDADDVWLQGKLSAQVAHLQSNPQDGACCFRWHVWPADADGQFRQPDFAAHPIGPVQVDAQKSGWLYGRLLFDCELLTTTVMLRASTARAVGEFDVGLRCGEDYDYWLRLSQTATISRLEPAGALYRVVEGSVSRSARRENDELVVIRRAVQRYGLTDPGGMQVDETRLRNRIRALVFQHGYLHLHRGDPAIALTAFKEGLRGQPWRPKLWLLALVAWFKSGRQARETATS